MSLKRQSRYRYSWRKPWAFENYNDMRKAITEREVYKKLQKLERHSAYKKPYLNWGEHVRGELNYSPAGWPASERYEGGAGLPIQPERKFGDCEMACTGGMLDCEAGGCDPIMIICGEPPFRMDIIEDPTGEAWVEAGWSTTLKYAEGPEIRRWEQVQETVMAGRVCIPPQEQGVRRKGYGAVVVSIMDAKGQICRTEHPIVDCPLGCCEAFTLSGNGTVNPSATWEGTIDPPCPTATVAVTSDCGPSGGSINDAGDTVSVEIGADDCGTFTVTVSYSETDCDSQEASKVVRINNTGQGGEWTQVHCSTLGLDGCSGCACGAGAATYYTDHCESGVYKYGGVSAEDPCEGTWWTQCRGTGSTPCDPCAQADGSQPPCMSKSPGDCGEMCRYWSWYRCEWVCEC